MVIVLFGIALNGCVVNIYDPRSFEAQNPIFFAIYSLVCLCKLSRAFETLVHHSKQIRSFVNVLNNILPFIKIILSSICVVFLIYGQIGIHLYGGEINSKTVEANSSKDLQVYKYLNFNDFPSAMITLWSLFLNSGWVNIMNQESFGSGFSCDGVFFITFIYIMNMFIMKVVLCLIIDAVLTDFSQNAIEANHYQGNLYEKAINVIEDLDKKRKNFLF